MKVLGISLVILLVLVVVWYETAPPALTTEQVIAEISRKVEKVESFRLDMTMEMQMMGKMMTTEAEIAFKKPEKMHMKTNSMGMTQEMFSSGGILWTYMPTMNMVTKMDMSTVNHPMADAGMGMASGITKPFQGYPEDGISYIETRMEDGVEVYIIEAIPPDFGQEMKDNPMSQMMPKKVVLMISKDSGLPHKTQMLADDGSLMMQQMYSNFRINIPIDDSEFDFTPPPEAQVMDTVIGYMLS